MGLRKGVSFAMLMLMNILRKILVGFLAGVLSLALYGLAWSNVVIATIHNRDTVKSWFVKSDFYNKVAGIAIDKLNEPPQDEKMANNTDKGEVDVPTSDPNVQAIIKQALNADLLKTNIEKVLDAGYDWLDHRTDKLDFTVDLTSAKQQLASGLADYAKSRTESLPPCGSGESAESFEPLSSGCRPKGVSADQVSQKLSADVLNGTGFLENPVITDENFTFKNNQSKPVSLDQQEELQNIRKAYSLGGAVMYIFAGLALLAALGMVFISQDHLKGIRKVGYVFITSGAVLLITYLAMGAASNWADQQVMKSPDQSATQKELGANLIRVISTDIKAVLLKYVICFLVLGLLAVFARRLAHLRNHHSAVAKGEKSPDEPVVSNKKPEPTAETDKPEPKAPEEKDNKQKPIQL